MPQWTVEKPLQVATGFTYMIILYAIAMADCDQDNMEVYEDVLKTKDGIDCLALYNSLVGRFPNSLGAFMYPIYGHRELPRAFCHRAAVKGCIQFLMQGKVGGYASVFEKYQEKAESFL
ncbi:hypothetical protein RGQ29_019615 [Quercus rubra]|uniref:Uncharacterized protein n=1 Tax=Quercus rubra TaxID=3512 RepID=A0AAN7IW06_QUERU|nr:hypothetical protein RGQ29_019615 [Quercus rubra]